MFVTLKHTVEEIFTESCPHPREISDVLVHEVRCPGEDHATPADLGFLIASPHPD